MRTDKVAVLSGVMLVAVVAAACSGSSPLSTGSTASAVAAPQPASPRERAMYAATIAAQAGKCGYNFDAQRVRAGYLRWETQQGTQPAELTALEQLYDTTRSRIGNAIANPEEFCSDAVADRLKNDLGKQLAGDYSAPMKKAEIPWWQSTKSSQGELDREKIFNPRTK